MKCTPSLFQLSFLCLTLTVAPAVASDITLFSNGPAHPTDSNAWLIDSPGIAMTSTFYIGGSGAGISGLSIATWLIPGDTLLEAEISITSQPDGGKTFFDGIVLFSGIQEPWTINDPRCGSGGVCDVYTETGSFGTSLFPGTYYLNIQNAETQNGGPVWWDENGGVGCTGWNNTHQGCPATTYQNGVLLPGVSLDPDLYGSINVTTPEPNSFLLLGSGIAGATVMLLRVGRRFR